MRLEARFLTIVMIATMIAGQGHTFCATALARSAESFCQYFQVLRQDSVNPIESFVLSLALAKTKPPQESCKRPGPQV